MSVLLNHLLGRICVHTSQKGAVSFLVEDAVLFPTSNSVLLNKRSLTSAKHTFCLIVLLFCLTFPLQVCETILNSGENLARKRNFTAKSPLMYEWYQEYYVGAAHGLAGIYYYLMQVRDA